MKNKAGEWKQLRMQSTSIKKYISQHFYQICVVMSVVLVTIVCFWNIGLQDRVRRIDDEIGYWGIAAQMAGYDWEDIMANLAYYSFGYSILLVPVFWLHRFGLSMAACYKVAILLNVVMLDATVFMALHVVERWAPKINKYYRLLCVLAITLYSNNIMQANTAWTETCVYFLYWCVLALAIKVFEKGKILDIAAMIVISIYMFTVHMRTIAVPIAVIIVIFLWFFNNCSISKGKKLKVAGITAAVFLLVLVAAFFIMTKVQGNIYNIQGAESGGANTFSSNLANLLTFFSIDGLKDLILGFLGKLYYQGVASYLFSYLGLGILLKTVYLNLKNKNRIKNDKRLYKRHYLAILIILSSIGSLIVSAIFMADYFFRGMPGNARADRVIYGRYTEFLVSVLILIGILYLGQIKKYPEIIVACLICVVAAAAAVQYQWDILSFYYEIVFANGVDTIEHYFYEGFENAAYYAAAFAIGIFGLACFICMREKREHQKLARAVVVTIMLIVFTINGIASSETLAKSHKNKTVGSVVELLQTVPEVPVYCVGVPDTDIKILQWELPERSIKTIEIELLEKIKSEEAVVISPVDHTIIGQVCSYENFIYSSGTIAVYANKATDTGRQLCENVIEARKAVNETEGEVELATAVGECGYQRADGSIHFNSEFEEGFMTWGTGLKLNDGIYEFTVEMEIEDLTGNEIGYVLATNEYETMTNTKELNSEDIGKFGKAVITIDAAIENYSEPLIEVYNYGNCEMKVTGITYRQIASETPRNEEEQDELRRILEIIDAEHPNKVFAYYIDSDGSGMCGEPNIMAGDYSEYTEEEWNVFQLPTWAVKYLEYKQKRVYILEKTANYEELAGFLEGFENRYETQHFILYFQG